VRAIIASLLCLASVGAADAQELAKATFAGGCFWCMEPPFDALDGVVSTTSGYTGGHTANPTYEQVSAGKTGHAEAVEIVYDPRKVTYTRLLEVFWRNIDPLTANAQFCDTGSQYRAVIFVHDATQRRLAEASKDAVAQRLQKPIVTEITAASQFWPAEEYHQDYYKKNPIRYKFYRTSCGRDRRLEAIWGPDAKDRAGAR
jgi:peptide-methionine (S)-S-oxide reductase